jgi:hypothetical protein
MSKHFAPEMFDAIAPQGTIRHTLSRVRVRHAEPVVLILRHAGWTNPDYVNAARKLENEERTNGIAPTGRAAVERIVPLFAEHVVESWEHVIGADGQPVPCTPSEVEALLLALCRKNHDLVDAAMSRAMHTDNFRPPMGTAEALGNG